MTGSQSAGIAVSHAVARLRSSFGVVACTSFAFWALGGTLVGVSFAFRATPVMALIADGGIVFTYLIYLGSMLIFVEKHREVSDPQ